MRPLVLLVLLLTVAGCGDDCVTRPTPAPPDTTEAPCPDDDCEEEDD